MVGLQGEAGEFIADKSAGLLAELLLEEQEGRVSATGGEEVAEGAGGEVQFLALAHDRGDVDAQSAHLMILVFSVRWL